jgi:outer membrane murein-binding lipoprotein Lpp
MEMGSTGVLVALVLTCFKYLESKSSKQGNNNLCSRVSVLEREVSELSERVDTLSEKLDTFHSDFQTFREEVRLTWAKSEAREEAIRELRSAP